LNIVLDLWFVIGLNRGVAGAAEATVISQYLSGIGIAVYTLRRFAQVRAISNIHFLRRGRIREIISFSTLTCVQQSVMNLGILMVQGLVNSFGSVVMAAFAAAVKIDAFAYMPVQDFGNAFSTFIAQNYGAKETGRIRSGLKNAVIISTAFCIVISALVFIFAKPLMMIFVDAGETAIIAEGVEYLRIEGAFYCGIGCLFLLYGLYRALGKPGMSVVLTIVSLGTRVALAYLLSAVPAFGVAGIWWSVPIGWVLADTVGLLYFKAKKEKLLS
jgi:Na+-driven multidrug efflux pump